MNSSAGNGGFFGDDNSNSNNAGYSYGIGVSVGILILITTITLASYFWSRSDAETRSRTVGGAAVHQLEEQQQQQQEQQVVIEMGIDEATIRSYPKLVFSKGDIGEKDSTATCCSICLADYKSNDMLRLLPECNHIFHLRCVDPWLRLHPTCPVCRTSPLPTPQSTPLADAAPASLAAN